MILDEMVAVLQAAKAGKTIQSKVHGGKDWLPCPNPCWDFNSCDYRAAPEPREIWVNEYPSGLGDAVYRSRMAAASAVDETRVRQVRFVEALDP